MVYSRGKDNYNFFFCQNLLRLCSINSSLKIEYRLSGICRQAKEIFDKFSI